jgi:hypothetical protein
MRFGNAMVIVFSFPGYLASSISVHKENDSDIVILWVNVKLETGRGCIGQVVSTQTREFSTWQPTCKYDNDDWIIA